MKKLFVVSCMVFVMFLSGCYGSESGIISEEKAKQTALSEAGLSESDVTFVEITADLENGRRVYDIEFYTDDFTEYDYEIDAVTGDVLSVDEDAENYMPPANKPYSEKQYHTQPDVSGEKNSGIVIDEPEAKLIALKRVPGSVESDIREFRLEFDDGKEVYEGKIVYDEMEYEFEIDAYTGDFLSWETESVYD